MNLIINGDDYGMNERCSLAIAQALSDGLITNATMMATGDYFEEAAAIAVKRGFADRLGIHMNLTEGRPLTSEITSTELFVRNGYFHKDYLSNPRQLTSAERSAVTHELEAQTERILQAGIPLSRADSHHYIHTFLHIAPIAAQVCRANGIRRIRINRTFNTAQRPVITEGRIDNEWWRRQGFITTVHFGRMSDLTTEKLSGDTEIMVHPDFDKNGVLIDRTGTENGFPTGVPLETIRELIGLCQAQL